MQYLNGITEKKPITWVKEGVTLLWHVTKTPYKTY